MSRSCNEARAKWGSLNVYNDDVRSAAASSADMFRDILKYGYVDEYADAIQEEDCCDDSIYISSYDDRWDQTCRDRYYDLIHGNN